MILAQDRPPLVGYDQDLWESRLRYRDVDFHEALDLFLTLRRSNMRLWAGLSATDLARVLVRSDDLERATEALRDIEAAASDDSGEE